jgi:hypothetical protein
MNIDRFDAHDRLLEYKKQSLNISECCQRLIDSKPFGEHAFYIFAHCRTADNGYSKRLIWQPRLTKPKAQTNSMLFKVYPGTDIVKVIWMIPPRELFEQYKKGHVTEENITQTSIRLFDEERYVLERKEYDDLEDYQIDDIYRSMSQRYRPKNNTFLC